MKSLPAISILVAAASSLLATEQDDPRFAQWMKNSREAFAKNHLIADVKLESIEGKPHSEDCRYDRYPGKVERIQLPSGLSYARKNGKKWIEIFVENGVLRFRILVFEESRPGDSASRSHCQHHPKRESQHDVIGCETLRIRLRDCAYPSFRVSRRSSIAAICSCTRRRNCMGSAIL
jgi:hypothetical protein